MKNKMPKNLGLFPWFVIVYVFTAGLSLTAFEAKSEIPINSFIGLQIPIPDTGFVSGDTVNIYLSGSDSIFILHEDTTQHYEETWDIGFPTSNMLIELTHHHLPVNEGVNGINITDMFEVGHGNFDENVNYANAPPDPWEALVAAAPKTLRIFSGAGSKFMHPLGFVNPDGTKNGGYGYDINEIIPYYDITGGGGPIPSLIVLADDILPDNDCDDCDEWMEGKYSQDFADFFIKWNKQQIDVAPYIPAIPLEDQPLYINQLIDLVREIEEGNEGHHVEVILCLNILSSTASECKALVQYLRTNTEYPINVVGVELGNEVYFDFQTECLGFVDFEHYWDYIHGETYAGLSDVLPASVLADHDFITALKGDPLIPDIKIGLPARNLPNCGEDYNYPITPNGNDQTIVEELPAGGCPCEYPAWNTAMVPYYGETIIAGTEERYEFDAIIFHTYYTPTNNTILCPTNSNWRDILLTLHPDYNPDNPYDVSVPEHVFPAPGWDYVDGMGLTLDPPDDRLDATFKNITGVHYPAVASPLSAGNYKEFTRDRIDLVYEEHAEHMLFTHDDTEPENKEVWVTEYNLDDKIETGNPPLNARLQPYGSVATNTFSHAVMLQNWFLWHLKSTFNESYRPYFLTYATMQNYISGSSVGLMTKTDLADQRLLGEITGCDEASLIEPHQARRATYYGPRLWKKISEQHLEYMKSFVSMYEYNDNLAPTVFIHPTAEEIYVYYTNVKPTTQRYAFDPGTMNLIYDEVDDVDLGLYDVTGEILDADQLYSTAGRNSLFKINLAYEECADEVYMENRFELTGVDNYTFPTSCPPAFTAEGGVCVAVPGYSMGYFKISFDLVPRLGQVVDNFIVYPNPTSNSFYIQQRKNTADDLNEIFVKIYTSYGNLVESVIVKEGEPVNISGLPVGVYTLVLQTSNGSIENETLVKMK